MAARSEASGLLGAVPGLRIGPRQLINAWCEDAVVARDRNREVGGVVDGVARTELLLSASSSLDLGKA